MPTQNAFLHPPDNTGTQRVVAYIDGFNLYYGLRSKGWRRYYWLDVHRLAEKLLRPGQRLAAVKYFTARLLPDPSGPGKPERQSTYLEALETLPGLTIYYGYFLAKTRRCPNCGQTSRAYAVSYTHLTLPTKRIV